MSATTITLSSVVVHAERPLWMRLMDQAPGVAPEDEVAEEPSGGGLQIRRVGVRAQKCRGEGLERRGVQHKDTWWDTRDAGGQSRRVRDG